MRELLTSELQQALRDRDTAAVAALRSALAAIGNAEAVPGSLPNPPGPGAGPIAGAVIGLGAGEAARHVLSDDEVAAIVRAEIEERQAAAVQYRDGGHEARAGQLLREADVLTAVLARAGEGQTSSR
jgi:uncharacterized protein YqeY